MSIIAGIPSVRPPVLIVDDEEAVRNLLSTIVLRIGGAPIVAESAARAKAMLTDHDWDCVIVDKNLPDGSGMKLLAAIREAHPKTAVLVITAFANTESAIQALRLGAFDYLTKPGPFDEVVARVENAGQKTRLARENRDLRYQAQRQIRTEILTNSPKMRAILATIEKVATARTPVLIEGESGVGKELVAQHLHRASTRASRTFVDLNCAAVAEALFESELFGHVRGAFAWATEDRAGLFEAAHGGVLLLDEVGDLPLDVQPKLLRFLEHHEVHPLGEAHAVKVDVRIIAATNANLDQLVAQGQFREDLLYRLKVLPLHLPPLRERREEIPALLQHYLQKHGDDQKKGRVTLSDETLEYLLLYSWPGNIRQLANEVRRIIALAAPDAIVTPSLLSPEIQASRRTVPSAYLPVEPEIRLKLDQPLPAAVEALEQTLVRHALEKSHGRVEEAARLLGISRKGLFLKRRRSGMQRAS